MRCEDVVEALPEIVDGNAVADRRVQRHVETCLRCQAELVQYRRLLKALHLLRTEVLEPAPGLIAEVLAGLEAAGERRAIRSLLTGRTAAYAGAGAGETTKDSVGATPPVGRQTSPPDLASPKEPP
ncbi:MAG: anti-sigma factor family protein, partial [Acidimicrobiales bacterium]